MKHTLNYKNKPNYRIYHKRAIKNYPNDDILSEDQFKYLSEKPCFYCGAESPNGIDRFDNKIGYKYSNCRSCCKHCNYVKGNLSIADFNTWKYRFVEYNKKPLD